MKKKLIEVALPLDKINAASAKEKNIRQGHPSTLHLWWARRPLAACRAVLFASIVDDPSAHPDRFPTEESQQIERDRLFAILERIVQWENSDNEDFLRDARQEIFKSSGGNPPPVYDPFCGGGSIPLEAQRLGLKAFGSDLNPVAVLITKAMIEIPPRFAGATPVNPDARARGGIVDWQGPKGLADDVRYYGKWMRDQAWTRIGHLYPKVRLSAEMGGTEAPVIAWLWTRTVNCPNPACGGDVPLIRSFALSTKKGREVSLHPIADRTTGTITFDIRYGSYAPPEPTISRRGGRCLICGESLDLDHIRKEGAAGRMSRQLTAIVADTPRGRAYIPASNDHSATGATIEPDWRPETELSTHPQYMGTPRYGLTRHSHLFTERQLVALTTFCDLVEEAHRACLSDGATPEYAQAVATFLGLTSSRLANTHNALALWSPTRDQSKNLFSRQAIPMTWDFAEVNPFGDAAGDFALTSASMAKAIEQLCVGEGGTVRQADATRLDLNDQSFVFSTDPPYYDNVPYADLSDFFYIWLRRSLRKFYPELFGTVLVPKASELVADVCRHGNQENARTFFEAGFTRTFETIRSAQNSDYPLTVFYAFKQAESEEDSDETTSVTASTGWETMLEGLLRAGYQVTGTWPLRSERGVRVRAIESNALASSIVLACRPRLEAAAVITEMDLQKALRSELPKAVRTMQQESIAPVDLAQAAIGPGMAIYSRYSKVLGPDGKPIGVRKALEMINRVLDEVLSEQEGEFDPDTRFALAWFQQFGMRAGTFGTADVLSRAMNIGVTGLETAGILEAKAGTVRLLKWESLPEDWDPAKDQRLTVWEMTHHLIRLMYKDSDAAAARVLAKLGDEGEKARDLAYRLYQICERSKWSQEAQPYNALVVAWPNLTAEARRLEKRSTPEQMTL